MSAAALRKLNGRCGTCSLTTPAAGDRRARLWAARAAAAWAASHQLRSHAWRSSDMSRDGRGGEERRGRGDKRVWGKGLRVEGLGVGGQEEGKRRRGQGDKGFWGSVDQKVQGIDIRRVTLGHLGPERNIDQRHLGVNVETVIRCFDKRSRTYVEGTVIGHPPGHLVVRFLKVTTCSRAGKAGWRKFRSIRTIVICPFLVVSLSSPFLFCFSLSLFVSSCFFCFLLFVIFLFCCFSSFSLCVSYFSLYYPLSLSLGLSLSLSLSFSLSLSLSLSPPHYCFLLFSFYFSLSFPFRSFLNARLSRKRIKHIFIFVSLSFFLVLSIYLSICLPACVSVCLSIYLSFGEIYSYLAI